uniref:UDP-glycosyltransferase 85A8 n=1 Tax=Stevia rebaudiana TaxID=55670 RepID=U85A8_STERE|nr:RecName: Full=UDP-glycosyltransferase 85A8 [Stevia rebaudiana]AAR06913.1 UDP-glycosyltransferase 85A8 [Stevia rebaudiana]
MASIAEMQKPHAICIPYPAQGHINPMMQFAKLLHFKGFHISFVNNHYNHKRLQRSRGLSALEGLPDFHFYSIPDGLPPSNAEATQSIPGLCESIPKHSLEPFCDLIATLNGSDVPPVSCIISDGVMSFTLQAAERFGLPEVLFWTPSACGFLAYTHYRDLVDKEYIPLKDTNDLTNGYLETSLDWIPGMKNIRLKDFPSFIRTTDINDIMLNYFLIETEAIPKGVAIILNTFDALEKDSITPVLALNPQIYTIGPLHMMQQYVDHDERLKHIGSNLWKEDVSCINWLDTKKPNSVVYVNFGSITVMTKEQLIEFGWGLANSKKDFLWITRPDIVGGNEAMIPAEFIEETKERGMVTSWCSQEEVLKHPSIGVFLTHSGWNSTIESISNGVPMICWPFFAEQQTNCRYCCVEWEIGLEIDTDVKREEVEAQVREMMDGSKGKMMKNKALEWKKKAEEAVSIGGSSYLNFEKLVTDVLLRK